MSSTTSVDNLEHREHSERSSAISHTESSAYDSETQGSDLSYAPSDFMSPSSDDSDSSLYVSRLMDDDDSSVGSDLSADPGAELRSSEDLPKLESLPTLRRIIQSGDLKDLERVLIQECTQPERQDELNAALIQACSEWRDEKAIHLLLEHNADVNAPGEDGNPDRPLHVALKKGWEGVARILIDSGADIGARGKEGRTSLHIAAVHNCETIAALVLDRGADMEAKDDNTWTPIHLACGFGALNVLKLLISRGANINDEDNEGWTPLHQASYQARVPEATVMLQAGANVHAMTKDSNLTSLLAATLCECVEIVELLLQHEAPLESKTLAGFGPLHLAVLADSQPLVHSLAKWSAKKPNAINVKTIDGATALHIAAGRGLDDIIRTLLFFGADTSLLDSKDCTPMQVATKYKHYTAIEILSKNAPDALPRAELCEKCQSIDITSDLHRTRGRSRRTKNLGNVAEIVNRTSCPFCRLVSSLIPWSLYKGSSSSQWNSYHCDVWDSGLTELRIDVQFTCNDTESGPEFSHGIAGHIQAQDRFDLRDNLKLLKLEDKYHLSELEINYKRIRTLLRRCEKRHQHKALDSASSLHDRTTHPILLIDVDDMCLVDGSVDMKYLALSYVWGRVPGFQATKSSRSRLKEKGSLSELQELPSVIRDAIAFVQKLKERYLWIDALCVIQDDMQHKMGQLTQMDLVYNRAYVTLIASTAADATEGLRGVNPRSRLHPHPSVYINNRRYVAIPPSLSSKHAFSKYSTRGWTLQENLLSPRCLYVTDHRVYYSCHGSIDFDHIDPLYTDKREERPQMNWFLDGITSPSTIQFHAEPDSKMTWEAAFILYNELITASTARSLSFESDAVDAVMGPLMVLSQYLGPFNCAGLPTDSLDHALLWRPSSSRNKERNIHFPSWSWAGWRKECTYRDTPIGLKRDTVNPLIPEIQNVETFRPSLPQASLPSASGLQILVFQTKSISANNFTFGFSRAMNRAGGDGDEPQNLLLAVVDGEGRRCGILYEERPFLKSWRQTQDKDQCAFILLSRSLEKQYSWLSFSKKGYKWRENCMLNGMLVKPVTGSTEARNESEPDGKPRVFEGQWERVAIAQIHEDAWNKCTPVLKEIALV